MQYFGTSKGGTWEQEVFFKFPKVLDLACLLEPNQIYIFDPQWLT